MVISDVTTMTIARRVKLYVIIAWITIHFGRNPRNEGGSPTDGSDMNIMNFINMLFLFVIQVWLVTLQIA